VKLIKALYGENGPVIEQVIDVVSLKSSLNITS
jgi:hypothetical protein